MKVVLQDGVKDCGICSLLSLIRYYGGDVSKEYLREISGTNKSGVTALGLIIAARKIGFMADGVAGDLSKIEKNNLPCLAHVILNKSYKHFVAIYDINLKSKKVVIMDPARGKRVLSLAEFKLISSGNYIFLKPIKHLPIISKKHIIKKLVLTLIKKNKILIIFSTILTFSYFTLQILTAFHFKYLLEFAINFNLSRQILVISSYLFILYIFREGALVFRDLLLNKWVFILDKELTSKIYKQILLLPYLYFRNRTTGEVVSRIKDLNVIKSFLAQCFSNAIVDVVSILIFGILLFKSNRKLTGIIFIVCFIFVMSQIIFNRLRKVQIKNINRSSDVTNSYLIESFTNIETVKGSHLEKRIVDTFSLKYQKLLEDSYNYSRLDEVLVLIKKLIYDLLISIILGYGSYLVVKGRFSLGNLIIYQSLINYFLNSFARLLEIEANYHNFKLAKERIEDLFLIRQENFKGSFYYLGNNFLGNIEFKNLSYYYLDKLLLDNISFSVKNGERVLLVGASGSGKSTLMKILLRYLEVPFGNVLLNNIDINHIHLDLLRNNVTYVSNLDTLFSDTIYNNIVLNRSISEEEFLKIVEITKVYEFVSEDIGYKKMVEENGINFSNGERQRIILARALVKRSAIYIFDEAFSQIDSLKTNRILSDIFNYLEGKTIIVISHRFNQQKLFDKILKLEKGHINEVKKL